jgi:hypothetical protein
MLLSGDSNQNLSQVKSIKRSISPLHLARSDLREYMLENSLLPGKDDTCSPESQITGKFASVNLPEVLYGLG